LEKRKKLYAANDCRDRSYQDKSWWREEEESERFKGYMADKSEGRTTTNCKGQGAKSGPVPAPPWPMGSMSMMQVLYRKELKARQACARDLGERL
jgi:hypothetical protein